MMGKVGIKYMIYIFLKKYGSINFLWYIFSSQLLPRLLRPLPVRAELGRVRFVQVQIHGNLINITLFDNKLFFFS